MGVKGVRVGSADVRGAEGMKGGAVRGKKKGGGDGTGGARATHFRQHEGERGAKGSVLHLLFKHIPLNTETLQSEYTETPAV